MMGLITGFILQTICNIKPKDIKDNDTIRLYDFKMRVNIIIEKYN